MTTCLKGYVTLWVAVSHSKSGPSHVGGYWFCASGDIEYLFVT